jgi:hypothetical protein
LVYSALTAGSSASKSITGSAVKGGSRGGIKVTICGDGLTGILCIPQSLKGLQVLLAQVKHAASDKGKMYAIAIAIPFKP